MLRLLSALVLRYKLTTRGLLLLLLFYPRKTLFHRSGRNDIPEVVFPSFYSLSSAQLRTFLAPAIQDPWRFSPRIEYLQRSEQDLLILAVGVLITNLFKSFCVSLFLSHCVCLESRQCLILSVLTSDMARNLFCIMYLPFRSLTDY